MLTISLSNPDLESYIQSQLAAGTYPSMEALVAAALVQFRQPAPAPKLPDRANPSDWATHAMQSAFREAFGGH